MHGVEYRFPITNAKCLMKPFISCVLAWCFSVSLWAQEPDFLGKADPVKVAKLQDGSVVFGTPVEAHCTIKTRYGKLDVAWADVVVVQAGYRLAADEKASIEAWLAGLAAPEFTKREAAQQGLMQFGQRAAPALRQAMRQATPDYLDRGRAILTLWKLDPDDEELDPKPQDRIFTEKMEIVGELENEHFTLRTKAFGTLTMPWKELERVASKTATDSKLKEQPQTTELNGLIAQPGLMPGPPPPLPARRR